MNSGLQWPGAGQSADLILPGPAGDLEAMLSVPKNDLRGVAVICHPHPQFGGAMSNKVVYTLAAAALDAGLASLRFNFRGVGRSQGSYDHTHGETRDCVAAAQWLQAQQPQLELLLAGFSFGAYVSLKASAALKPKNLITVAPPFGRYFEDEQLPDHPACPWLVIHSRDDDTVPFAQTRQSLAQYDPEPEMHAFDGAGHFFQGRLADVRGAATAFLQSHW